MHLLSYLALCIRTTFSRGRQRADVAMLIRRVRERFGGEALRCAGTSQTTSSTGRLTERRRAVAGFASRVFRHPV